jgi:3',5'-cyclic AMP phosphodiesterase CpdA
MLRTIVAACARAACLAALWLGSAATAQPPPAPSAPTAEFFFVQLADTQFGAFTGDRAFDQETANYEFAVANINRLKPAFVVICGDLINKPGDPAQRAEYQRITALIDPAIPVYAVAGNHDVGNAPTAESLADYREHFGRDYYGFQEGDVYGIVLNSSLIGAPEAVMDEAAAQERWLEAELVKARASGAAHVVVFQHHSWFIADAAEPTAYFNIPLETRQRYVARLKAAGVRYVFAGHYHRNALAKDGDLEMITTGPVGRPLGPDPSGFRIVRVTPAAISHEYFGFGTIPNTYPPAAAPGRGARGGRGGR